MFTSYAASSEACIDLKLKVVSHHLNITKFRSNKQVEPKIRMRSSRLLHNGYLCRRVHRHERFQALAVAWPAPLVKVFSKKDKLLFNNVVFLYIFQSVCQ